MLLRVDEALDLDEDEVVALVVEGLEEVVGLELESEVLILEDRVLCRELVCCLADEDGRADPPEVKAEALLFRALVPRLAEDMLSSSESKRVCNVGERRYKNQLVLIAVWGS